MISQRSFQRGASRGKRKLREQQDVAETPDNTRLTMQRTLLYKLKPILLFRAMFRYPGVRKIPDLGLDPDHLVVIANTLVSLMKAIL